MNKKIGLLVALPVSAMLCSCGGGDSTGPEASSGGASSSVLASSSAASSSSDAGSSSSVSATCSYGPSQTLIASAGKTFSMGFDTTGFLSWAATADDSSTVQFFMDWAIPEVSVHSVSFTYSFKMDVTEVTQRQMQCALTAAGYTDVNSEMAILWTTAAGIASMPVGDNYPAYNVTPYNAAMYANARSIAEGLTPAYTIDSDTKSFTTNYSANGYRLATEAEWEYAARAGSTTDFFWGKNYSAPLIFADSAMVSQNAVWYGNSGRIDPGSAGYGPQTVGSKLPNAFGLYDMAGNLSEWVNENSLNAYGSAAVTDPQVMTALNADNMLMRGGNWTNAAIQLRSSNRTFDPGSVYAEYSKGLRLVRKQ